MHRLLRLSLVAAALPAAGLLYQAIGARRDRKRFLQRGALIDIGEGRRLYLSQMGVGNPTVIFESGIAATSLNWTRLQQSVSSFAHTVTYDRAGLGWSSPCTSDRTPSNIVRELRLLLQQAGIPPPYLLVGHSFGGLVVRHFATAHPNEVAGVVLVDPLHPGDWTRPTQAQLKEIERGIQLTSIAIPCARFGLARLAATSLLCRSDQVQRALNRTGWDGAQHILDRVTCEINKMPREIWPIVAAHWSSPAFYRGMAAHLRAVPASVREMQAVTPIEKIPITLLTAATAEPLSPEALRRIGPSTQQTIAANSTHWLHLDEPDLVLEAIRSMIEKIRSPAPEDVEALRY